MKLLTFGDSWTYGWDLIDPNLRHDENILSNDIRNTEYRVGNIWPTHLSKLMNREVFNYSISGSSNDRIAEEVFKKVMYHIDQGTPSNEIFVIIGWSSPERRLFWWHNGDDNAYPYDLQPHVDFFREKTIKDFQKAYLKNFYSPREYFSRYVNTVFSIQAFLRSMNIKACQFNAFYHPAEKNITDWSQLTLTDYLSQEHKNLWRHVDPISFYKKNEDQQTFHSFVKANLKEGEQWVRFHPSATGHKIWADELHRYINQYNLQDK